MTPAARWAAAAQVMDDISAGAPAEKALTNWARKSRFAGSKDRAAVRDHVFDILRNWRSAACLGGGSSGRHLVLGRLRQTHQDAATVFSGEGYALPPLKADEIDGGALPKGADDWDLPDWLYMTFVAELGDQAEAYAKALKSRAPVFLRVNTLKTNKDNALRSLADAGITAIPHPLSPTALEVTEGARRIAQSEPYLNGLVELQDAASQAVVEALPFSKGARVLDYCAGGGGKTLAMAAKLDAVVDAHDAESARMKDLPIRAKRAGAKVNLLSNPKGPYDLVLIDAPCSGSGAWRRAPEGKWRLSEVRLAEIKGVQAGILDKTVPLVQDTGALAYATCSVLPSENEFQVEAFLERHPEWICSEQRVFSPSDGGDGFYIAILTRSQPANTR